MQPVTMYSTAWCPYCRRAKALLASRGVVDMVDIDIDQQPAERATMMRLSGRSSVPQIFIGDTHVGGCDDLMALDRQGALLPLLEGG